MSRKFSDGFFIWFLTLILIMHEVSGRDNSIKFKHIYEGLSQSTVLSIMQDRKGFIWIGANNGLNRYDGAEFTIYESSINDLTTLSDSYRIDALLEDDTGNIWVGTSNGLNRYLRDYDAFTRYLNDSSKPGTISDNFIEAIGHDNWGNLWVGTANGLNRYHQDADTFSVYKTDRGLLSNYIETIMVDSKGILWVETQGGHLHYYDKINDRFIPHDEFNKQIATKNVQVVYAMAEDTRGYLWLGTSEQGILLLKEGEKMIQYTHDEANPGSIAHDAILSIFCDRSGNMWVGTQNYGLDLFNQEDKTFSHFVYDANNPYSLSSNSVHSIFEDKDGRLWFGTFHTGLNVIDLYMEKFSSYRHIPTLQNSLSNNVVTSFLEDKNNNLWIGTDGGGLNYYDRRYNRFTHFRQGPGKLKSNAVLSLCYDNNANIWIGTWEGGINIYNQQTNSFSYLNRENCGLNSNHVFSLLHTKDGKIYAATFNGGLGIYDIARRKFTSYPGNDADSTGFTSLNLSCLYQDRKGEIWIGTFSDGLYLLRYDNDQKVSFTHFTSENSGLSDNIINTIYEDLKGNFWIGTFNGGLNLMDRKPGECRVYLKENGLPSNTVMSMLEDDEGNLWIGTASGFCKFNPRENSFRIYHINDGLQGKEFSRSAAYKTRKGEFLFGGTQGFNLFNPDKALDNPFAPDVYITGFRINNRPVYVGQKNSPLKHHISETSELVLSYKQSFISFDYIGLNYSHGDRNKYAYILEGLEDEWNNIGNYRTATYTNLSPGEYIFRVKAANNDNRWNKEGASIKITITPPFWATWWFRIIVIITIISGAYFWYRQRMNRIKKQNRLLETKVQERTEELQQKTIALEERSAELKQKTVALEASKQETDDILLTVKEGLFLLNGDFKVGSQYAQILESIFERKDIANQYFFDLLEDQVDDNILETTKRFLDLMFKEDVNDNMLEPLNPLNEVKFVFNRGKRIKYLTFEFSRIKSVEDKNIELMATVRDITEQILLEQKLKTTEERTNRQMNWLLSILHVDPHMLQEFIESASKELTYADSLLDLQNKDRKGILKKVYRSMHLIKGNASLLALDFFAKQVHNIEDKISELQDKVKLVKPDFDMLAEMVGETIQMLTEVNELLEKIGNIHTQMRPKRSFEGKMLTDSLQNLIKQLGDDFGKKVTLDYSNFRINEIPHQYWLMVREVLVQLIRNAVTHGIETPEERLKTHKPEEGKISIKSMIKDDMFQLSLSDDGRGIQVEKLKERVHASGNWDTKELKDWKEEDLVNTIFTSGISTADAVDMAAGRGVGLDSVKDRIDSHKGTISLDFKQGKYTCFNICLPLPTDN